MSRTGPLDAAHRALGAKMGAFAGWEMPISYRGTLAEHGAVRTTAGLFDVSHLGKIRVRGEGAAAFLDAQLTNVMTTLAPGRARYTLICNEQGGIVDDLIVYALGEGDLLAVPNAANRDLIAERWTAAAPDDVAIEVLDWTTLAVQGPASPGIVEARYPAAKELRYMRVATEGEVVIARSGYTGEVGYEVFTPAGDGARAWDELLAAVGEAGGEPCGLAARDTLRLEMGYPLHGNDIDDGVTPFESGLAWAVALEGRSFVGAEALAGAEPATSLIGLRMRDKLIPRRGLSVLRGDRGIGTVTSGTFSPTLKVGIALARVERGAAAAGDRVAVDVRGRVGEAEVVEPPFVASSPK